MSKLGTVVIGGGTGFIGTALRKALKKQGYDVITVSRKPGLYHITWGDLTKSGLPKCTAVINIAGQNVLDPTRRWTPGFQQNVWASRVNTTKTLAEAIAALPQPPKVFASISGVGYYKSSEHAEYTEDSSGGGFDFLSRLCADWESANNISTPNVRRVIVRSGVVLGRQGGMIKNLYLPFYCGLGGPIGAGTQYLPWIHVRDIVGIFLFAIQNDNVTGVLNGVSPNPITNAQFTHALARAMWRPTLIPLPVSILNLAFSKERAKMMTEGQKVIPKRTLELGYKFVYPDIDSACREMAPLFYKEPE